MNLIDGTQIAQEIQNDLKDKIKKNGGRKPGLAFILIGKDPASQSYVKMKKKRCIEVGIYSEIFDLSENITEKQLLKVIDQLNNNPKIDGILVQQPIPKSISTPTIIEAIDPSKDVDGFHPINIGKLLLGEKGGFATCTPLGITKLLEKYNIPIEGKHVVIVGRSNIVGKPLGAMLVQKEKYCNGTVTIAHSKTKNLPKLCSLADILVAAIGKPHFITSKMVKKGAVVIDVGINHTDKGLVGDVDFEGVKELTSMITPVPGGVGPMTIAMLLSNTYESYVKKCVI